MTTTAGIDPEKIKTLNERSPVSIHKLIATWASPISDDPITELIAKSIVNVTASGKRDRKEVMERALN